MKVLELIESEWENVPEPEGDKKTRLAAMEVRFNSLVRQLEMAQRKIQQWVKEGILVREIDRNEGGTWLHLNFPGLAWQKEISLYFHVNPNSEKSIRMFQYLPKLQEKIQNIVNKKYSLEQKYDEIRGPIT